MVNPQIEAVLLTGGASQRMGIDKASLEIDGKTIGERTASILAEYCHRVTVLGKDPILGYEFQLDSEVHGGPRRALDGFKPTAPFTFVASCDMPLFSGAIVPVLFAQMGTFDAAIPQFFGRGQTLCALYKSQVLGPAGGEQNMKSLENRIRCHYLNEETLLSLGVDPIHLRNCNTLEEFREAKQAVSFRDPQTQKNNW